MADDRGKSEPASTRSDRLEQNQVPSTDGTRAGHWSRSVDRLICPVCHHTCAGDFLLGGELQCERCGASFRVEVVSQASTIDSIRVLGRFQLLDRVGQGTFGTVWRARDKQLDRIVALKIPHAYVVEGNADLERICREARSAARLRHPGIVRLYEFVTVEETPVLVSDFIEGLPLKDLLKIRRLTFHESAELVAQVAEALDHAHDSGLVHRDIKPANIMVERRREVDADRDGTDPDCSRGLGKAIIVDFGLAVRPEMDVVMTMDGELVGTPAYMSPEQAAGKAHDVDRRSDIYSLGVVLYQLLCGELPFRGTKMMMLHQVQHEMPRPPRRVNDRIPRDLETICMKAMAKLPSRRYGSAGELAQDLRRFLRGEPCRARPVGRLERAWLWARRNLSLAAVSVVTCVSLVAVAVFGVLLALRERDHATELGIRLSESYLDRGYNLCEAGDVAQGMLLMAKGIRAVPRNSTLARALVTNLIAWSAKLDHLMAVEQGGGQITAAVFSPDGRFAVTGSNNSTIQFWDATTLRPLGQPVPCGDPARALIFSPDSRVLHILRNKEKLLDWELARGQLHESTLEHGTPIRAIAHSHGGTTVAIQDDDKRIRMWDLDVGRQVGPLLDYGKPAKLIAFTADDKTLLTVSNQGEIRRWDASTGLERGTPGVQQGLWSAAVSPDGRLIATGATNGKARIWDTANLALVREMSHPGEVGAVDFSPDSQTLVTGCGDKVARFWDARSGTLLGLVGLHHQAVTAVAFSRDGFRVLTGAQDGTVQLRQCKSNRSHGLELGHRAGVWVVNCSPDGLTTVAGTRPRQSAAGDVQFWRTPTGEPLGRVSHAGIVYATAFSRDGRVVATASADGTALLVDVASCKPCAPPLKHPGSVTAVAFNPDGNLLFTGCEDGIARVWDVVTGRCLDRTFAQRYMVTSLAVNADGTLLVTASSDGTATLWSVASTKALHVFHHNGYISRCDFSSDGKAILTASNDGSARLWSVETGQPVGDPMRHENEVPCALFSRGGDLILTGSKDKSAQLWRTSTTMKLGPALLHRGPVRAVGFSPDMTMIATASDDSTARLWDLATGRQVGPSIQYGNTVTDVKFTPDGRRLIAGSADGTVRICDVPLVPSGSRQDWTVWVQALCGAELSDNGAPRALGPAEWQKRRHEVGTRGDSPVGR